jgi:hypothetical protein
LLRALGSKTRRIDALVGHVGHVVLIEEIHE